MRRLGRLVKHLEFVATAESDVGLRKVTNQDSLLIRNAIHPEIGPFIFAVICDGLGGLEKGELASATVIKNMKKWYNERLVNHIKKDGVDYQWLKADLEELIQEQNDKIRFYGIENGIQLGTTVTALLIIRHEYYILHIGDCRIYELTPQIHQITIDQTIVEWRIQQGLLTREASEQSLGNNILLQCVGAFETVVPEFYRGSIDGSGGYLLCSDGFRHKVTPTELEKAFKDCGRLSKEILNQQLKYLVALNKERMELDNITAAVIGIQRQK